MVATIWTVGHSTHEPETFLALLRAHGIDAVADVRSEPYSRRQPHFQQEPLRALLRAAGVAYVFLGRELGGRCEDPDVITDARVDFAKLAATPAFRGGLERLQAGAARHRIALLCAESDPLHCHRAILVARELCAGGLEVRHVLADGRTESHAALERRLLDQQGLSGEDLFTPLEAQLQEAYARQARLVAWRPPGPTD